MHKTIRTSLLALVLIVTVLSSTAGFSITSVINPTIAQAAPGVPTVISYQGRLTDSSGELLGGSGTNYDFKFSIWDSATPPGGTKLWPAGAPGTTTLEVVEGVFNANIGDTANGFPDALTYNFQDNDTVYLQVEVYNASTLNFETLSPRQPINSAGFAINAKTVGGFTPSQAAAGDQIPVLTAGDLLLGDTNPQINATGTNTLTLQGGGQTGDIQFFSAANKITSSGNFDVAGTIQAGSSNTTLTLASGMIDADAITLFAGGDAGSATTSSPTGLERVSDGLTLLQGCADNEILKWNEAADVWACNTDISGGGQSGGDDEEEGQSGGGEGQTGGGQGGGGGGGSP